MTNDVDHWIDDLLRSSEAAEMEAAPAAARVAVTTAIDKLRRQRSRRRSLASLAAAAATLAAIAAWRSTPLPGREGPGEGLKTAAAVQGANREATIAHPSPNPSPPRPLYDLPGRGIGSPAATFVTAGDAIAVPLASDDPQVSIVEVYPTTTTERRWRRELSLYAGVFGQEGG